MNGKPSAEEIARDLVVAWLSTGPWKTTKATDIGTAIGIAYEQALAKVRAAVTADRR